MIDSATPADHLVTSLRRAFKKMVDWFRPTKKRASLPPLPRHPERGIKVEKGDTLTVTGMSISVKDVSESEGRDKRIRQTRIPPWAGDYKCGAMFGLRTRLAEGTYNIGENRFEISDEGWTVEVGLKHATNRLFHDACVFAEQTLDLIATEQFRISELHDPLREHAVWFRDGGKRVLRAVTTGRLAVSVPPAVVIVRDQTGALRPPEKHPPIRWHPSYAYFRRSQATDSLDEAYRNLFLALEALLSEVYPMEHGLGESAWLKAALKHVASGYALAACRA